MIKASGELPRFDAIVAAPFGGVGVRTADGALIELVYLPKSMRPFAARAPLAREAARQIESYLADSTCRFDLPLAPRGTDFQRRVWTMIASIPLGQTRTYGDVARAIRSGPRAVGQACGANWFPLVIPCHRVLAANAIGGFAHHDDGFHLGVKRWLLAHEGIAGHA